MIATLLLVGGPDPADTAHLHDVRQALPLLPKAHPVVSADDVDTADAWLTDNHGPVVIAYTAHFAETWTGRTCPLAEHGAVELVLTHAASDAQLLDAAEAMAATLPLRVDAADGIDYLRKQLAAATTPRG